jgi:hypothetical protein
MIDSYSIVPGCSLPSPIHAGSAYFMHNVICPTKQGMTQIAPQWPMALLVIAGGIRQRCRGLALEALRTWVLYCDAKQEEAAQYPDDLLGPAPLGLFGFQRASGGADA